MSGIIDQVLVPRLFEKLHQFGDVRVSHRGEGNVYGHTTFVNGRARRPIKHWGESYRVACPFCGDRDFRLSVNYEYGQLGADGWPMTHLATCFHRDCLADRANRDALADLLLGCGNRGEFEVFRIEGTPRRPGGAL